MNEAKYEEICYLREKVKKLKRVMEIIDQGVPSEVLVTLNGYTTIPLDIEIQKIIYQITRAKIEEQYEKAIEEYEAL